MGYSGKIFRYKSSYQFCSFPENHHYLYTHTVIFIVYDWFEWNLLHHMYHLELMVNERKRRWGKGRHLYDKESCRSNPWSSHRFNLLPLLTQLHRTLRRDLPVHPLFRPLLVSDREPKRSEKHIENLNHSEWPNPLNPPSDLEDVRNWLPPEKNKLNSSVRATFSYEPHAEQFPDEYNKYM